MTESLQDRRARLMGPNLPTFYADPLHIVRGQGVWLWDAAGRRYLDAYNNVPHVGHCHPAVVAAIAAQAAQLNTHTRYLHDGVLDYLEVLTGSMGHGLDQGMLVCTGSEANDIALRMAQAVTGAVGIIATDATYHGNTTATAALSTRRPPIGGRPGHVRLVPAPDRLLDGPDPGGALAGHVTQAIAELQAAGHGFSGMMLCPFFANEGFPTLPPGFFDPAARVIRDAGGLILADEVQPGFGRLGSHMWGHDWLGIAPDVVTLGKSLANGHPVAAVVARAPVMAAFRQAFGYFNTFGGNPVAAAAALATWRVMHDEGLQDNAARTGAHALERLRALRHPFLHQVRGQGLFFGVELRDDAGAPATGFAEAVVERMRADGVLVNRIGRAMNILKIRPPMPFGVEHADLLADRLQVALDAAPVPA